MHFPQHGTATVEQYELRAGIDWEQVTMNLRWRPSKMVWEYLRPLQGARDRWYFPSIATEGATRLCASETLSNVSSIWAYTTMLASGQSGFMLEPGIM